MIALDGQVQRLIAQRKVASKQVKQAERARQAIRRSIKSATAILRERTERLARVEALYPNRALAPQPEAYKNRLKGIRQEIRIAEARRASLVARERTQARVVQNKKSQVKRLIALRKSAAARSGGAAGTVSALIKQMTELARIKAEDQAAVNLSAGSEAFSWPTTGRITQPYGCTGFKLNPAKGSCRHFHDGIDVVSGYGTPVRAVAVGVVAFSGWNPYDKEGRAYVVDVVHPGGFVSRYGHLIATNHVRAGELVHTGQVIGKMGSTGKSTGTHLHFELLRNGNDVNPVTYLPTGVVRVDKATTKAGAAEQERKLNPTPKPTPKPKPPKPGRTRSYPTTDWEDYGDFELCPAGQDGDECDPEALLARLGRAKDGSPGVPKPYRATSPASS
jgi:murein DD-endopeptidase MepM/ murein hydrolase activator NlpD